MNLTRQALFSVCLIATPLAAEAASASFDSAVRPLLSKTCTGCHNDRMTSGGLNVADFLTQESILARRDEWEVILKKLRTGEMPPKGIPETACRTDGRPD